MPPRKGRRNTRRHSRRPKGLGGRHNSRGSSASRDDASVGPSKDELDAERALAAAALAAIPQVEWKVLLTLRPRGLGMPEPRPESFQLTLDALQEAALGRRPRATRVVPCTVKLRDLSRSDAGEKDEKTGVTQLLREAATQLDVDMGDASALWYVGHPAWHSTEREGTVVEEKFIPAATPFPLLSDEDLRTARKIHAIGSRGRQIDQFYESMGQRFSNIDVALLHRDERTQLQAAHEAWEYALAPDMRPHFLQSHISHLIRLMGEGTSDDVRIVAASALAALAPEKRVVHKMRRSRPPLLEGFLRALWPAKAEAAALKRERMRKKQMEAVRTSRPDKSPPFSRGRLGVSVGKSGGAAGPVSDDDDGAFASIETKDKADAATQEMSAEDRARRAQGPTCRPPAGLTIEDACSALIQRLTVHVPGRALLLTHNGFRVLLRLIATVSPPPPNPTEPAHAARTAQLPEPRPARLPSQSPRSAALRALMNVTGANPDVAAELFQTVDGPNAIFEAVAQAPATDELRCLSSILFQAILRGEGLMWPAIQQSPSTMARAVKYLGVEYGMKPEELSKLLTLEARSLVVDILVDCIHAMPRPPERGKLPDAWRATAQHVSWALWACVREADIGVWCPGGPQAGRHGAEARLEAILRLCEHPDAAVVNRGLACLAQSACGEFECRMIASHGTIDRVLSRAIVAEVHDHIYLLAMSLFAHLGAHGGSGGREELWRAGLFQAIINDVERYAAGWPAVPRSSNPRRRGAPSKGRRGRGRRGRSGKRGGRGYHSGGSDAEDVGGDSGGGNVNEGGVLAAIASTAGIHRGKRSERVAAAAAMWMCTDLSCTPDAAICAHALVQWLHTPDHQTMRYVALLVWAVGRNPDNRGVLVEAGAIDALVEALAKTTARLRKLARVRPQTTDMFGTTFGTTRMLATTPQGKLGMTGALHDQHAVVSAFWQLLYHPGAVESVLKMEIEQEGQDVADLLLQSFNYAFERWGNTVKKTDRETAEPLMYTCAGALWVLAESSEIRRRIVLDGHIKTLFYAARKPGLAIKPRVLLCDILHDFAMDPSVRSRVVAQLSTAARSQYALTSILLELLTVEDDFSRWYAARLIARSVRDEKQKNYIALHGGCGALKDVVLTSTNVDVAADALHALVNLTTEALCQEVVGNSISEELLLFAAQTKHSTLQELASMVFDNMSRNPKNRTNVYKAELHVKEFARRLDLKVRAKRASTPAATSRTTPPVRGDATDTLWAAEVPGEHGVRPGSTARTRAGGATLMNMLRTAARPAPGEVLSPVKTPRLRGDTTAKLGSTGLSAPSSGRFARPQTAPDGATQRTASTPGSRRSARSPPRTPVQTVRSSRLQLDRSSMRRPTSGGRSVDFSPMRSAARRASVVGGGDEPSVAAVLAVWKRERDAWQFPHVEGAVGCDIFEHRRKRDGTVVHVHPSRREVYEVIADPTFTLPPAPDRFRYIQLKAFPKPPDIEQRAGGGRFDIPNPLYAPAVDAPVPAMHSVDCPEHKHDANAPCEHWGRTREPGLPVELVLRPADAIATVPPPPQLKPKDPWTLDKSIFKPRRREADSRDYFDNAKVRNRAFETDWARVASKDRVHRMVQKQSGGDAAAMNKVKEVVKAKFGAIIAIFDYYATVGSGDVFSMQMNAFGEFCDVADITDTTSKLCKPKDLQTVFIATNVEDDKSTAESKVNHDRSLHRFEFLEALIRIAINAFIKTGEMTHVADAVERLLKDKVLAHMDPGSQACHDRDLWRRQRLYTEECDLVLREFQAELHRVFNWYVGTKVASSQRATRLTIKNFLNMLEQLGLLNDDFTQREATLCFTWSRMLVGDELLSRDKYITITFTDFLEVMGRCADMVSLPTTGDMARVGAGNCYEYYELCKSNGIQPVRRPSGTWSVPPTRPLADKLRLYCSLAIHRFRVARDEIAGGAGGDESAAVDGRQ